MRLTTPDDFRFDVIVKTAHSAKEEAQIRNTQSDVSHSDLGMFHVSKIFENLNIVRTQIRSKKVYSSSTKVRKTILVIIGAGRPVDEFFDADQARIYYS